MTANESERNIPPTPAVKVTDWVACLNSNDNMIVLSCTVGTPDDSGGITAVGLILNTATGVTLASAYSASSNGSESVYPSINLPAGELGVGQSVNAVVQGQCDGKHFFFEEALQITEC